MPYKRRLVRLNEVKRQVGMKVQKGVDTVSTTSKTPGQTVFLTI